MIDKLPIENLNDLLEEMRPLLLAAGIPEKQVRIKRIKFKTDSIARAFDWLHILYLSPEYARMRYAWGLLPAKTWNNYEKLGFTGMREQVILATASENLCELWRTSRPSAFGTAKKKKEKKDAGNY